MGFMFGDIGGTQFKVGAGDKRGRMMVQVGEGKYYFTPDQAREFAVALDYFAMCADWKD